MHTSRLRRDSTAWVIGDRWQVLGPAEDVLFQAHMLETASWDLALAIMKLESQDGQTDAVLLAQEELHQLDDHLSWVEQHRHHASDRQVLSEMDQARTNAVHVLDILARSWFTREILMEARREGRLSLFPTPLAAP